MNRKGSLAFLAVAMIGRPSPTLAQPAPEAPPTAIMVRPAAEPRPALKYRLVPEGVALVPGNAALFYHRGLELMMRRSAALSDAEKGGHPFGSVTAEQRIADWVSGPLDKLPREEVRKLLESYRTALNEVELGATRASCDWELDRRTEGITLLLPELQEMRSIARLVALRARLAVLDDKTDEAAHWIETGMVVGRHVARGPTAIQALIGLAIESTMIRPLEDLIQAPGSPSLYWALADRPRPMVDLGPALEGERYLLEKVVPGLRELDRGAWGLDRARAFADELQRKLFPLASGSGTPGTGAALPNSVPEAVRRAGVAAMCLKVYPEARRALIAEGRAESRVEAMPVIQVAALYSYREHQRLRDDVYKWMGVPYWQSHAPLDAALTRAVERMRANPLLTRFLNLWPPLNSIRLASLRVERQFDILQCIEAVRLHAARGGALPERLESIDEVPTPVDPVTGAPFDYRRDGDTATLATPRPPGPLGHPSFSLRYVLKPIR